MYKRAVVFSLNQYEYLEFEPIFKIEKCPDSFPQPSMQYAHHPYFIEYKIEKIPKKITSVGYEDAFYLDSKFSDSKKVEVSSRMLQNQQDNLVLQDLLCLINSLSNSYFFQYQGIDQSWCINLAGEHKLFYAQKEYIPGDFEQNTDVIDFGQCSNSTFPLLTIKSEDGNVHKHITLNELLDIFYSLECDKFKTEFINACTVFNKALELEKYDISSSYLLMVSSIETLISIEYKTQKLEPCNLCTETHYAVTERFRNFIDKYGYEVDRKTKNNFYKLRSNIAHLGQMMRESYTPEIFITNDDSLKRAKKRVLEKDMFDSFKKLTRVCFRVFLLKNT